MNTAGIVHHVRYNRWATARVLDSARTLTPEELAREMGTSYKSLRGTLEHIYQADAIWFARLMERPTGDLSQFQPPAEPDAFEKEWMSLHDRNIAWAEALTEADWDPPGQVPGRARPPVRDAEPADYPASDQS